MFRSVLLAGLAAVIMVGCSPKSSSKSSPEPVHTGDVEFENHYGFLKAEDLSGGMIVYVAVERLNLRSTPEAIAGNIVGILDINDKLQIVDPRSQGPHEFVAVRVLESKANVNSETIYYTSAKHLNETPLVRDAEPVVASKFFVVTNVATEKVRVYKTCESNESCINKMIFEQDVVNGEDKDGTRTSVGHFRVTSWEKFYETPGRYPAWFKPGYPAVPSPGASMKSWFRDEYMPGRKGEMRGAFGWYTMKVGPNPAGQWMHGTAGWGQDKKKYIMFKESALGTITNLFTAIRSHGCTRIDNESIAYLRNLIPLNTTYVKIYAKEAYRDRNRSSYDKEASSWSYILTKNGGGKTDNHQLADREAVLADGTPQKDWIEEGTLSLDQYPDAVALDRSQRRAKGGDLYKLGEDSFKGVFVVDEGTVVDYQHPKGMIIGGYPDGRLPNIMSSVDRNYTLPEGGRSSRR